MHTLNALTFMISRCLSINRSFSFGRIRRVIDGRDLDRSNTLQNLLKSITNSLIVVELRGAKRLAYARFIAIDHLLVLVIGA